MIYRKGREVKYIILKEVVDSNSDWLRFNVFLCSTSKKWWNFSLHTKLRQKWWSTFSRTSNSRKRSLLKILCCSSAVFRKHCFHCGAFTIMTGLIVYFAPKRTFLSWKLKSNLKIDNSSDFLPNYCFFWHKFGTTNALMANQSSKGVDFYLVLLKT